MSLTTEGFLMLVTLVVRDFYFIWAEQLYRQRDGLPMGSRLSPILANLFMEKLETTVLRAYPLQLKLYVRYVDDIFMIYDLTTVHLRDLLDLLNSQNPQIRLTCEEQLDRELPFLDLLVQRAIQNGPNERSLTLSIHRKPTHNHKYLHYRSRHPLDLKRNGLRGHWLRA